MSACAGSGLTVDVTSSTRCPACGGRVGIINGRVADHATAPTGRPRSSSDRRSAPRREVELDLHLAELCLVQAALELEDRWAALVLDLPGDPSDEDLASALHYHADRPGLLERLDALSTAARAYRAAATSLELDR